MKRWLIWIGFVAAWSIALELPAPNPENLPGGEFITSNRKLVTKSIHVCVYVAMTVLSAWVMVPLRYRWLMMFFLMAHASVTELVQYALKAHFHRTGELTDVGFDHFGILIGIILSWKWWTRQAPP